MHGNGELGPLETALYRRVLLQPDATVPALAAALEQSPDELGKPLATLVDMGVLRTEDGERYTAVSPMLAEATVLGNEDLELAARRAELEARRNAVRSLVPEWNLTLAARATDSAVDITEDPAEIGNVIMHFADQCHDEVLSISPGGLPFDRVTGKTQTANLYSLRRGIRTRALYQTSVLRDRDTFSYLRELSDDGARIRFMQALPMRTLIVDREVALIRIPRQNPEVLRLAVVREPNVVAWIVMMFEQLWGDATDLAEYIRGADVGVEVDPTRRAILRLMGEGEKDESIARKLSISVRTARRHIAEYMTQVGALSRFQAGVIAAKSGHTDVNSD